MSCVDFFTVLCSDLRRSGCSGKASSLEETGAGLFFRTVGRSVFCGHSSTKSLQPCVAQKATKRVELCHSTRSEAFAS
jgi:hypothetical protein